MLDLKYRPKSIDECIGHKHATTTLRGFIKSGRPSQTILITGPTSVGKTTLGRAFAGDLNGYGHSNLPNDYLEIDGGQCRTKDELLPVIRQANFLPQIGKFRVILIDEFQHVLSNSQSVPMLLKALEEPPSRTIWILCSMDPGKFETDKNGKAILTRSLHLSLNEHTNKDLYQQGVRIIKGEKYKFIKPDLLKEIVKASNNQMRTLAFNVEALAAYHSGLSKPRVLNADDLVVALKTASDENNNLVLDYMVALYSGKFADAQRAILYVADPFQFVNQCLWAAKFMLNVTVLNGARHPKVWWTPLNKELHKRCKIIKPNLGDLAAAVSMLVQVKSQVVYGNLDDTLTVATFKYLNSHE